MSLPLALQCSGIFLFLCAIAITAASSDTATSSAASARGSPNPPQALKALSYVMTQAALIDARGRFREYIDQANAKLAAYRHGDYQAGLPGGCGNFVRVMLSQAQGTAKLVEGSLKLWFLDATADGQVQVTFQVATSQSFPVQSKACHRFRVLFVSWCGACAHCSNRMTVSGVIDTTIIFDLTVDPVSGKVLETPRPPVVRWSDGPHVSPFVCTAHVLFSSVTIDFTGCVVTGWGLVQHTRNR